MSMGNRFTVRFVAGDTIMWDEFPTLAQANNFSAAMIKIGLWGVAIIPDAMAIKQEEFGS